MKVIDNFLPEYHFNQIQSIMMDSYFPWYYNSSINSSDGKGTTLGDYQFTHTFYDDDDGGIISDLYTSLMTFCANQLGKCNRVKANLNPRTRFHRKGGYHIDFPDVTTAILYINTNNGWTHIKKHGKVKSVANRIVIFDSNLKHTGVTCTDKNIRVLVNFNFTT
tara:strand:- start:530 stop:1021 length:492 start_codon:yes stop_codon:yes gene_type:complete